MRNPPSQIVKAGFFLTAGTVLLYQIGGLS
jgi:hypothetical protein